MVKEGESAPSFSLPSTAGTQRSLKDFRGKKLVVFFYPKDETPGCTREACGFRDNFDEIRDLGAEVIGVSKDSITSHDKFRTNHALPFELLSDADNAVASAFGAYGEKKMYGRTVMGTIRSTILIDESGKVERVWSPVRADGHVEAVVEALGGTPASSPAKPVKKKVAAKAKTATKKKVAKKKATKKKVTKKEATKKTVSKKKVASKKAPSKKKVSGKKKASSKKPVAKKKASSKSKTRTKVVKKKAVAKKKSSKRR